MEQATDYTEKHVESIGEDVKSFVLEVNPKFLTTLKYKFSKQEYKEVASLPFKFWKAALDFVSNLAKQYNLWKDILIPYRFL